MTEQRGVVAVIVRWGTFLVIRRSAQVIAPGQICFPGGGLLPGEDELTALRRELDEELALDQILPRRCLWHSVTPRGIRLSWWLTDVPDSANPRPNPSEVAECFWADRHELMQRPDLLISNRAFFQACDRGEIDLADTDGDST